MKSQNSGYPVFMIVPHPQIHVPNTEHRHVSSHRWSKLCCLFALAFTVILGQGIAEEKPDVKKNDNGHKAILKDWTDLFDGTTLKGWKKSDFAGQGEVEVRDQTIFLGMGASLTGITTSRKDLPKTNYEVRLKAMRVDGFDFFCGLTFQVGEEPCSLIIGGWGGGVVGLSSIDGFDASENSSTSYRNFKEKQWYQVRLKVTDKEIQAWIDDDMVVDINREDRKFSIRPEVDPSIPFGLSSYSTKAAIKEFQMRRLE